MESKSDKQLTQLNAVEKELDNAMKIKDWIKIQTQFEQLNREVEQINRVASFHTETERARMQMMKRKEMAMLISLEAFLAETLKDGVEPLKTSMKKPNYAALTAMRQKLKKHMKEPERIREVASYRVQYARSDERESVTNDQVCLWLQEHLLDQYAGGFQMAAVNGATLLDIDEEAAKAMKIKDKDVVRLLRETERIKIIVDHEDDEDWDPSMLVLDGKSVEGKGGKKGKGKGGVAKFDVNTGFEGLEKSEVTDEMIEERVMVILQQRGKRGTDLKLQVKAFAKLLEFCERPEKQLSVLVQMIASMFDCMQGLSSSRATKMWRDCHEQLMALVKLLNDTGLLLEEGESTKTVDEFSEAHEVAAYMAQMEEEGKTVEMPQPKVQGMEDSDDEEGPQPVMGNLGNFMEQLAQAFFKSMQNLSPESGDYITRLQDESRLLEAAGAIQAYYVKVEKLPSVARMAALQVEHMYYKHDSVEVAKAKATGKDAPNPKNAIHELALMVYRDADDDRTKTRTMLCQIYHHALHDRFYVARDMLLMSRQQDNIQYEDISTQVLFNRMMVQLGLCAFRLGLVQEAHDCLTEIAGSSRGDPTWRAKELLAQGITARGNRPGDAENEKQERRRQMPYHMHIDLDFIEACHMTAAMLLEVPAIAAAGKIASARPVISRTFMRYLEHYEKSWHGPPESIRETVLFTASTVARGDWQETANLLTGLACWKLILGGAPAIEAFKAKLVNAIKEAALRTYLYTYGAQYDSLSLVQLSKMFSLDENRAHSIVSRMLHEEEVNAAWDQPTKSIVMMKMEPSRLQELALAFADKCAVLIDANEKILDAGRGKNQNAGGGGAEGGGGRGGGGRGGGDRDRPPPRKGFGGDRIGGRQGGFLDPSRDWKPRGGGGGRGY